MKREWGAKGVWKECETEREDDAERDENESDERTELKRS